MNTEIHLTETTLTLDPYLQHTDNLHFVEENEGGEGGQEVLLKHWGRRQYYVLDVLNPVGLVDFLPKLRVRDRDHFLKLSRLGQEFPMSFRLNQRRVVLEATDHIHDTVIWEHHLEKGGFVEEQDPPHDLIEVVQAFSVVQVLAYSEEAQQFLYVALTHQSQC